MTVVDKNRQSALAREEHRKVRIARAQVPLALAPATIEAEIGSSGLLEGPRLKKDGMKLVIPLWDNHAPYPDDVNQLELYIAPGHTPAESDWVSVLGPLDFVNPFADSYTGAFTVPLNQLQPDGPYSFRYVVTFHHGGTDTSAPVNLVSDIIAPYELKENREPPSMTLTHRHVTEANISTFFGVLPTDRDGATSVVYWYAKAPLPEKPEDLEPVSAPIPITTGGEVPFPEAYIRNKDDGQFYIIYALIDAHRNRSALSVYTKVDVTLGELPTDLKVPKIPVAAGGAVIDMETAAGTVLVEIDLYTGWKNKDEVHCSWGPIALGVYTIGTEQGPLITIEVPAATMKADYGNVSIGEKDVKVSYIVKRGEILFGPEEETVKVDFSIIGPPRPDPDPDWPDGPNPALLAGVVTGKSEPTKPNQLFKGDEGEDATFTFKLHSPAKTGETVEFFWKGVLVTEATFTVTTETGGEELPITIPWEYVLAGRNGPKIPVHYSIGSPDIPESNRQKSVITEVDVNAIILRPDEPVFNKLSATGWLNCQSLEGVDHAIVVNVPDLTMYDIVDNKVTMTWTAYAGRVGTTPITGTEKEEELTLGDADYPAAGFQWRIQPYEIHIAPTYDPPGQTEANAVVTYSFTVAGETDVVTSIEAKAPVGMFASGACNVTP